MDSARMTSPSQAKGTWFSTMSEDPKNGITPIRCSESQTWSNSSHRIVPAGPRHGLQGQGQAG